MAGRYFGIPFATTGDRITVPDATQPDGSVSFTQGFGFDYERPKTDPAYKPVPRDGTNGIFHDITEALGIAQRQGVSDWTVDAQPYPINALVRHTDKVWRSLVANNNVTPTEGASWTELSTVPQATEAVAGIAKIATNATASSLSDNTTIISPEKLGIAVPVQGGLFRNLKASATGIDANISVTADFVTLDSPANGTRIAKTVNLTINSAATGANGLDTGTSVASTWYSVWVISNGTATAGLLSLSSTAPTLPGGYTHKARVGWIRTDATANKYPLSFVQYARTIQYKTAVGSNVTAAPKMYSGATGGAYVAVGVTGFVPPTASSIDVMLNMNGGSGANPRVASNPDATLFFDIVGFGISSPTASDNARLKGRLMLESNNIYLLSTNATGLDCGGWEDNL